PPDQAAAVSYLRQLLAEGLTPNHVSLKTLAWAIGELPAKTLCLELGIDWQAFEASKEAPHRRMRNTAGERENRLEMRRTRQ
ncbi:unnamed protein product, partial [Polarella glacialis]